MAINKKVHKTGKDNNFGRNYWIGVKSNRYASDWSQISISPPWYNTRYIDTTEIEDCLVYCDDDPTGKWCDFDCTRKFNSVCEYDI